MLSHGYGPVLVVHAQLPTFADTATATAMPAGEQLRYWSLCSYEVASERYYGCLRDDQVAIDPTTRQYTVVVSDPADRPSCATNWLPFGPATESVLIMRNMLPDPGFREAIQNAKYGSEASTMGAYYPTSTYTTRAALEAHGCQG